MTIIRNPKPIDSQAIRFIAEATGWLSVHSNYMYWLCTTIYSPRSFVACDSNDGVIGYLLSIPGHHFGTEFLLQIGVHPLHQNKYIGIKLLSSHWKWMQKQKIRTVQTSVNSSCVPGQRLLRIARLRLGHNYMQINWASDSLQLVPFAQEELLYEAQVEA